MAIGNYESIGFDSNGMLDRSCELVVDNKKLVIYKNWLYFYIDNTAVATIREGYLELHNPLTDVYTHKTKNGEFFAYVREVKTNRKMTGIGIYAYQGDKYIGIQKGLFDQFHCWLFILNADYAEKIEVYRQKTYPFC